MQKTFLQNKNITGNILEERKSVAKVILYRK